MQNQYYASSFTDVNQGNKYSARGTLPTRSAQKQSYANVHISQLDDNSLQRTGPHQYQASNMTSMSAVIEVQNNSQNLQEYDAADMKQYAVSQLKLDEEEESSRMQPQDEA